MIAMIRQSINQRERKMENKQCKSCGRVGCWTKEEAMHDGVKEQCIWICKCGEEYMEKI